MTSVGWPVASVAAVAHSIGVPMLKQILIILSVLSLALVSCKKKKEDDPVQPQTRGPNGQPIQGSQGTPVPPAANPPVATVNNGTTGVLSTANQAVIGSWKANISFLINNELTMLTMTISQHAINMKIDCDVNGYKASKEASLGTFTVNQTDFWNHANFVIDASVITGHNSSGEPIYAPYCKFNLTANDPRPYSVSGNTLWVSWGGTSWIQFTRQ